MLHFGKHSSCIPYTSQDTDVGIQKRMPPCDEVPIFRYNLKGVQCRISRTFQYQVFADNNTIEALCYSILSIMIYPALRLQSAASSIGSTFPQAMQHYISMYWQEYIHLPVSLASINIHSAPNHFIHEHVCAFPNMGIIFVWAKFNTECQCTHIKGSLAYMHRISLWLRILYNQSFQW